MGIHARCAHQNLSLLSIMNLHTGYTPNILDLAGETVRASLGGGVIGAILGYRHQPPGNPSLRSGSRASELERESAIEILWSMKMLLRNWRLLTIMLTALSLGPALGHLLELPAKMSYEGALWLTVSQTLYATFGTVGAAFEVGAVVATVVLAIMVRQRRPAFGWTIFGAVCVVVSHAAFWIWLAPVNATISALTIETLPSNWLGLRNQWEYTHAARAVLQVIALGALVFSIHVEKPSIDSRDQRAQ